MTPAVILNVQRQPGANTITVVNSIQQVLPQLKADLPTGINVTTLTDLTTDIKASVSDVEFELILTVVLVVLVIFLFLRSLSATIIPSVAVPLSIVGTFAAMYALGYSLDNLSLMALTISTGFVVDDAIVMIENISRFIEEGHTPMQAALEGRGADRLHHSLADGFVDCRADSPAVHGRSGGAALPRICRHPGGDHRYFRRGVAHPYAHDVLAHLAPQSAVEAGAFLSGVGARFRKHDRVLRPHAKGGPALPDDHAAGGVRQLWCSRSCCTSSYPRDFSRCRIPASFRGFRRRRRAFPFRRWRKNSRSWQRLFCRTRRWRAFPPSSARTARIPPSIAAGFPSI